MATLGTFVNRFVGVRELTAVPSAGWFRAQSPCLPPLANEDVYLFVKRSITVTSCALPIRLLIVLAVTPWPLAFSPPC